MVCKIYAWLSIGSFKTSTLGIKIFYFLQIEPTNFSVLTNGRVAGPTETSKSCKWPVFATPKIMKNFKVIIPQLRKCHPYQVHQLVLFHRQLPISNDKIKEIKCSCSSLLLCNYTMILDHLMSALAKSRV